MQTWPPPIIRTWLFDVLKIMKYLVYGLGQYKPGFISIYGETLNLVTPTHQIPILPQYFQFIFSVYSTFF